MQNYIAYTDGGCQNLSTFSEGASAYIILKDGKVIKTASKGFLNTTSNRMEILAILSVVCSLPEDSSVTIYSDSEYAIKVLSGQWRAKTNHDLIVKYRERAKYLQIKFQWVRGHNGNHYNEVVDRLCTEAMKTIIKENNLPSNRFTKIKPADPQLFQ